MLVVLKSALIDLKLLITGQQGGRKKFHRERLNELTYHKKCDKMR